MLERKRAREEEKQRKLQEKEARKQEREQNRQLREELKRQKQERAQEAKKACQDSSDVRRKKRVDPASAIPSLPTEAILEGGPERSSKEVSTSAEEALTLPVRTKRSQGSPKAMETVPEGREEFWGSGRPRRQAQRPHRYND